MDTELNNGFPDYIRCIDADYESHLTVDRIYQVHAHDVRDDFFTIKDDEGNFKGNYGYRFEPATEGEWMDQFIDDLFEDWPLVGEPEPDIYEAADIEAEKARMSPEALDGTEGSLADHLQELADLDADLIHQPDHYARWAIEPITYIMRNGFEFWRGNIVKYASRAGFKQYDGQTAVESEITDLKKVIRYAQERIAQLEGY